MHLSNKITPIKILYYHYFVKLEKQKTPAERFFFTNPYRSFCFLRHAEKFRLFLLRIWQCCVQFSQRECPRYFPCKNGIHDLRNEKWLSGDFLKNRFNHTAKICSSNQMYYDTQVEEPDITPPAKKHLICNNYICGLY